MTRTRHSALAHPRDLSLSLSDDDGGQFEPEEDEADKMRRMVSESPINKIMPIPEGSSFFLFAQHNK